MLSAKTHFALGLLVSLHAARFGVLEDLAKANEIANRLPNFRRFFLFKLKTLLKIHLSRLACSLLWVYVIFIT